MHICIYIEYPALLLAAEEEELCGGHKLHGVQDAYAYKWVRVYVYVHIIYMSYMYVMYRCIHTIPGALAGGGGGGVVRRAERVCI